MVEGIVLVTMWHSKRYIKVLCQLIYIILPNFKMAALKDDSMEVHYIGFN